MALRVWLPLNGNFNNQGNSILSAPFSITDAVWEAGKIGNNLKITKQKSNIVNIKEIVDSNTLTCCLWFKLTPDSTFTAWQDLCAFGVKKVSTGSTGVMRLEVQNASGSSVRWYANGLMATDTVSQTLDTVLGQWYHMALVITPTKSYSYFNGVYAGEWTLNNDFAFSGNVYLGDTGNMYCTLADFRIYDEELSAREIKEISKGLVTHYKMIGSGANENIIPISFSSSWNTNGSTNTFTKLSDYSFSIQYTADTISGTSGRYKGINGYFTEGKTYTFSYDLKGDGNYKIKAGFESSANIVTTTTYFKRYSCTYTATTTNWQAIVFYASGNDNGLSTGSTITIRNMKLEEGEIATQWEPAHADTLYTALGYANNICTDVSGNGYTAIKNGTLTFNTDSPRYSGSTKFNSGYFHKVPSPLHANSDAFTVSCWFYPTVSGTQAIINDRKSVGDGLSIFYYSGTQMRFDTGSSYQWVVSASDFGLNKWNFLTFTWDKNEGIKKYYLNGNLVSSTTNYGTIANIGDVFSIGNSSTNGAAGAGNQVYGSLSDFRIYATALSADDILTMYKNSGIIDNKNNVYTYEFKEE